MTKSTEPIALTVEDFCSRYGLGKSKAFELMKAGVVERVKIGSATRITRESADRWFASLPRRATGRAVQSAPSYDA